MPKPKSMLKKCEVEVAQRQRTCKHTRRTIVKDEVCLVIFDGERERFCYSREIALKMVAEARTKLDDLCQQLASSDS